MSTTSLRAGMSGCGGISQVTLEAARRSRHFEVVAVQDPHAGRLATMSERYGIERRHDTFEDLLTEDVDFVIMNGPNDVHLPHVERATAAGKHCLVQKPMAPTLGNAEYMVDCAEEAEVLLGVLMLELGDPVHHQVKAMVEAGFFGKPTLIQATSAHTIYMRLPPPMPDWRRDPTRVGGGAFIQLAIHAIDLARWFLDDRAVSVFAGGARRHTVFQDETTLATVQFERGAIAHFAASYATDLYGFALCGTRGRIHLLDDHVVLWGREAFEGDIFDYTSPGTEVVLPRAAMSAAAARHIMDVEIHDVFARWILGTSDYPCPGEEGVEDLRVIDAAYRSLEEKRWIDLD